MPAGYQKITNFPNGIKSAYYVGGEYVPPALIAADGAVGVVAGANAITKGSALAGTLAAPTAGAPEAGGDDGAVIVIYSETAFAHVITCASVGFNGKAASGTLTFGAAKGNGVTLLARNGQWWVLSNVGVTVA